MESTIDRIFRSRFCSDNSGQFTVETRYCGFLKRNEAILNRIEKLDENVHSDMLRIMEELYRENSFDCAEYFAEGFCMGAKLMIEVLTAI